MNVMIRKGLKMHILGVTSENKSELLHAWLLQLSFVCSYNFTDFTDFTDFTSPKQRLLTSEAFDKSPNSVLKNLAHIEHHRN